MANTTIPIELSSTPGIVDNSNATAITIDSSENVGIGVSPPSSATLFDYLFVNGIGVAGLGTEGGLYNNAYYDGSAYKRINTGYASRIYMASNSSLLYDQASTSSAGTDVTFSTALKIDSSGNLLVGTTDPTPYDRTSGNAIALGDGLISSAQEGGNAAIFNRMTNDGSIVQFRKDGTAVGSIGTTGGVIMIGSGNNNLGFFADRVQPLDSSGAGNDNAIDLGYPSARFDDIYATNGTIQTSDRNEKQDIESLSDAETRVAVAAKGLLRKFRWQSAVEEKGDEARIHFGIIAQDLQDAFTAEGLDAGDYAMFISSTWWETQTEVAAVEAVEATEDTEAVEAVEAYTRIDTYHTAEEAPEGATEITRLGVRYSELLAFIIAAI
jgi:hypothetical protein